MTSQINELIARNGMVSFEAGRKAERERVFRILDELAMENKIGQYAYISDIKEYIKDEEYK